MKFRAFCLAAFCAVLVLSVPAQAELINAKVTPALLVTFDLKVVYDADGGAGGNGLLTATVNFDPWGAWTSLQDYSVDGVTSAGNYLGYFFLEAEINKTTLEAVSGTVSVSSDQSWGGFLDGDLDFSGGNLDSWEAGERAYSTNLVDFGFGGYGLFDFLFWDSTGDLPKSYEPNGRMTVIINGASCKTP